ncbi:restriction endonuclease subunit S [bacterium]|nr:MAG: restriction endonuclease subunit S [bacterium]
MTAKTAKLGDVCSIIAGQSPPGHTYSATPVGLPFFQGKADFGPLHPTPRVWCSEPLRVALPGDILISVRAPVGPTNVADVKCCIGRGLAAIRSGDLVSGDFLLYFLRHFETQLASKGNGSTFGAIGIDVLSSLAIPLPPKNAQREIAQLLSQKLAAVDHARAAAEERVKAATALAVSCLSKEFDDPGLQMHPKRTMGEIVRLLPSKSISSSGEAVLPVITTACLSEFGFDPAGIKEARMSASDAAESRVTKGEILIARSNTPDLVGRVSMFPGMASDVFASDLTIRIFPQEGMHAPYLMYFLMSLYIAGYWKERAGGASGSMKKITRTHIQNLEVPIPPSEEQVRISKLLDEAIAGARQLRSAVESHLNLISALPSTLLSEAFKVEA